MSQKYDHQNIFAKIIRGEIPSRKVFEDEKVLAFHDISKASQTHILVIPKGEYICFDDFILKSSDGQIADFFRKVREIAEGEGLKEGGYRLISNKGSDASQSVPHFHVHILGGEKLSTNLN